MISRLEAEFFRNERSKKCAEFINDPRNTDLKDYVLDQKVHEWCVGLIRDPEKYLSTRVEFTFESANSAINYVEMSAKCYEKCIIFGYNLDVDVSLLMSFEDIFSLVRRRNTVVSLDGIVISNVNNTLSFILDYEDVSDGMSTSRVFCSVLGGSALIPSPPVQN